MFINQILINQKKLPNNLSNLQSKVDKLNIGELETILVDLSNLTDLVKSKVVKKTEYD